MPEPTPSDSRLHDLFGVFLGAGAAGTLLASPWLVDTSGPDPFYKGPLIYPLMVLSLVILASLPSAGRLARPPQGASWRLDGEGFPFKPLGIFFLLLGFMAGLILFGLRVSCLLFLGSSLYSLGHRRVSVLVLLPVIVTGLVFLVFKYFLDIYFPPPLLMEWLEG